jgi:hypothetical protein
VADHSKIANSTVANAYHHPVADHLLGTSGNLEITLHHVSLTFLAHAEALETAHLLLGQPTLTPLLPLLRHRLSAVASVVAVGEVILNSVVVVVVGGISTIATYSEGIVHHQYHAGRETHARSPVKLVSQKGVTKDDSTGVTKNADPNGQTESAM